MPEPEDAAPEAKSHAEAPFVFLSYASQDRNLLTGLHQRLAGEDLTLWWDQDIASGGVWREEIARHLEEAAVVVTFWTAQSTASKAVIEEAARAQRQGKLVHTRLDAAPLPYGFGETQYTDLRGWDGSADHPAFQALLAGIRAKLATPDPAPKPGQTEVPSAEVALAVPAVQASATDFAITDAGVEAHVPPAHQIPENHYPPGCLDQVDALIQNSRHIAQSVSNKLGEDTKADLKAYADHLEKVHPANPHRLSFLAKGIHADLTDGMVADGFSQRLKAQLADFLALHEAYLEGCLPIAAEAIRTKDAARLTQTVSKEEVTEVLNKLEEAIAFAEAATDSYSAAIEDLRAYDNELNALKIRAFSEIDQRKLDAAVQREMVELATFGARLYWRAQEVVQRVRLHTGDVAIAASTSGKTAPEMARAIVEFLKPVMQKLSDLLTALPPV